MNRHERRAKLSAFHKQLKTAVFDDFKDMSEKARPELSKCKIGKFLSFYANSIYSVQMYEKNGMLLMGIRKHDETPHIPFNHKMAIKEIFFGQEVDAIEIFPKKSKLVDMANIYWLWSGDKITSLVDETGGLG